MKKLILAIALFASISAQAKTLQERMTELDVLQTQINSAIKVGTSKRVCFLAGQFYAKSEEIVTITDEVGAHSASSDRLLNLLPLLEAQCR